MFFKKRTCIKQQRAGVGVLCLTGWRAAASCGFAGLLGPGGAGRGCALTDRPSSGSWLIPAALQPAQNSFLHREMENSDGCPGNRGGAKPFPFSTNENSWGGSGGATEVITKSSAEGEGLRTTCDFAIG